MKSRVQKLFKYTEQKIDAILIMNSRHPFIDDNFFYITGLQQGIYEGSSAVMFPDGKLDLFVTELEEESAKKSQSQLHVFKSKSDRDTQLQETLASVKIVGINGKRISQNKYDKLQRLCPQCTFIDISDVFSTVRLIKEHDEISLIQKACEISDKVLEKIPDLVHEGMVEYEAAAEINYLLQKYGAEKSAFDTISSFGQNTAEPHYTQGETVLKQGDFCLFDFGACYQRYNSDVTRTFILSKASDKQRKMYETVLAAQQVGLDAIKPGVKASDVHKAVSAYIDTTQFKGCFIHSTGHSLGMAVHDGMGFSVDSTVILEKNMVFTVEPGVYIPGVGGVRIEDDIVVTSDGVQRLSKADKECFEI